MSRRRNKRGQRKSSRRSQNWFAKLLAHPIRLLLITFLSGSLIWLVVTKSLPFALAPVNPELALRLNPDNPQALLVLAARARARMLKIVAAEQEAKTNPSPAARARSEALGKSVAQTAGETRRERAALRENIRKMAEHVIRVDPLNATAYRLLGEVSKDQQTARKFMRAAVSLSRREAVAVFWLMNDAYIRKDYASCVTHATNLLRTSPLLSRFVMSYLSQILADPKGRPLVVNALARAPRWRWSLIAALSRDAGNPNRPLDLLVALKKSQNPLTARELLPYLNTLIRSKQVGLAYNAWLQFLPEEKLATLGLIYNSGFETDPDGLPFGWQSSRPQNATSEFGVRADKSGRRALHMVFSRGRVKFPVTSQVIILVPGQYNLTFDYRGTTKAKRGLRWRLRCLYGRRRVIGQSGMLPHKAPKWRKISATLTVPDRPDCRGQSLALIHDARSASEEFIEGEVWLDNLKLQRIKG